MGEGQDYTKSNEEPLSFKGNTEERQDSCQHIFEVGSRRRGSKLVFNHSKV